MSQELWKLDATAQAALVRSGGISVMELVDAAIARIELLNDRVNAVTIPLFEDARERARRGGIDGPFCGVPMLLKDASIEVEGTLYTLGTALLRDAGYVSRRTSLLATRLLDAGFIFLGKTNTPELSAGVTTEPAAYGPARNPWDLSRTTSGSSGGSAAAVACGMTAVAHGGDGTGSLRYPAAACGVVTLKPSRGLVPHETPAEQPDPIGVWSQFVLARSVRDLAGVLDAIGPLPPTERWHATPSSQAFVDATTVPPRRLRVGLLTRDVMAGIPTDEACVNAVRSTGTLLADLGHEVDEEHPPALDGLLVRLAAPIATWGAVARAAQLTWLATAAGRELRLDDLDAEHFAAAEAASRTTAAEVTDAFNTITREVAPVNEWFADHDLLVTPVLRQPAWPLGQRGGAMDAGVFPAAFSFTGQSAGVVPIDSTGGGLPVGVQIVAAYGRDDLVLQTMAQIEEARPWADRWPALVTS